MCAHARCSCMPYFLQMYKTSFWGVLTCFVVVVLELLPFLHSHLHFPAQAFSVLVCYAVSSHKPAATYLHSVYGLQIFCNFGFLSDFGFVYATDFCLCSNNLLCSAEKKKEPCILLCYGLWTALWRCFLWQLAFYCGEKTKWAYWQGFRDLTLLIAICMASCVSLASWMIGRSALTLRQVGHSHINNTFCIQALHTRAC